MTALPTVVLIAAMIGMGIWQLDRAQQKRAKLATFEHGTDRIVSMADLGAAPERYQHVRVRGTWVDNRQILLDGISSTGRPGYQVLTAFQPQGSDALLMVNRGWRAWSGPRQQVDGLQLNNSGVLEIRGRVDRFWRSGLVLGDGNNAEDNSWPRIAVYPQHAEIAGWLGAKVHDWQLLMDADMDDGFVRKWQPGGLPPSRHIGYAVQWFALSLTLLVLYLVISMRKKVDDER